MIQNVGFANTLKGVRFAGLLSVSDAASLPESGFIIFTCRCFRAVFLKALHKRNNPLYGH